MYKTFNLIENYKQPRIINEGTIYEVQYTNALFIIKSVKTEEEMVVLCNRLNTEKPAEYKGNPIDWNKIEYFSYNEDINNELIF